MKADERVDDACEDAATIIDWDGAHGTGVARTDFEGCEVWLHSSMHAPGSPPSMFALGARIRLRFCSTPDQDGYRWIGEVAWPLEVE
ncbi:hypothetical protein [Demequina salsinemoris]|uniref:hypothetical protein n=1 Tax=Demequina salsinemoris TaxID=577470 RepID=UPI0007817F3F|nr:hypothetical protein [Demequina salsinemoris]